MLEHATLKKLQSVTWLVENLSTTTFLTFYEQHHLFHGKKIASVSFSHSSCTILCHSSNKLALFGVRFKHCFLFRNKPYLTVTQLCRRLFVCLFVGLLVCFVFFIFIFGLTKQSVSWTKITLAKQRKMTTQKCKSRFYLRQDLFLVVE